jgi:hypothetical protein
MRAISTSSQGPGRGANRAGEEGLDLGLNDALLQHCGGGPQVVC